MYYQFNDIIYLYKLRNFFTILTQPLNQVIIWDKIIKSPNEAFLRETNEFVKYALIDQGKELR